MYIYKTDICKFKAHDNIRWYEFCLESVSKGFTKDEQSEIALNGTIFDFLVYTDLIEKEEIPNIHHYLMISNNVK